VATHAAGAVLAAQREEQLRTELGSRDSIGQAKGMLMERFSVDADEAFGLLSRLSQDRNEPLVEVARTLIEAENPVIDRPEAIPCRAGAVRIRAAS